MIYNNLGAAIDSKAEVIEIRDRYEEEYGHRGGYFTVIAYDQVMIYATCLEEVGTRRIAQPSANALAGWRWRPWPVFLTFDQETHLAIQGPEYYPIQFYQIWEGERIQIEPDKYATGSFQVPPWMGYGIGRLRP